MESQIETFNFPDDGETPNHPALPVVVLRQTPGAMATDPADWFESTFVTHGWSATWRWGIYPFDHFHTTNHEVLGVSRGKATVQLGGRRGAKLDVVVGDVLILPAGTGHRCIQSTDDFQVVGAYPDGLKPDLIRSGEGDLVAAQARILAVKSPAQDPVAGREGILMQQWMLT